MTDIVERLRERSWFVIGEQSTRQEDDYMAMQEAADEIERLRAENERLRRAVALNASFDTPLKDTPC